MTSQKDIQSLIADIDSILSNIGSRLPWSKPDDAAKQRQVLERVRSYLVSQQQNLVTATAPQSPPVPATPVQADVVKQIAQAVTQEMHVLRADLMQPLQTDLEAIRHERESLVKEIRELEKTKQQLDALTQQKAAQQQIISEFSQQLISRSTETLAQQLAQILVDFEAQFLSDQPPTEAIAPTTSNRNNVGRVLPPQERLEQLRQLQMQSDQLLTTLDASQRTIFEILQRNLQGYHESLSQGLEKMHSLGLQGEMLFTALVNRLAQQLGREASTLLQPLQQPPEPESVVTSGSEPEVTPNTTATPLSPPVDAPVADTSPTLGLTSESTAQDSFLEALNSEDIEELDFENLDTESDEEIDTFIQLNIDSQESPSLDNSAELAELQLRVDNRRQEIEDLYESLFGNNALTGTAQSDPSASPVEAEPEASEPATPPTDSQPPTNNQLSNAELVNPLSPEIEEVLFEGLADPATDAPQAQPLDFLATQSAESWEALFFEDLPADSPIVGDFAIAGQPSSLTLNSRSNQENANEREGVETIAALTDLFEQMGLSRALPAKPADSRQIITPQESAAPTPDPDPQTNLVEDDYIPASPEEDLLATEALESEPEAQIWLDQNTLQRLSEDLHSFEGAESQTVQRQEELSRSFELPAVAPEAAQANPQNRWFPVSEELLAEDWEEFALNDLSDQEPTSQMASEPSPAELSTQGTEQFDSDAVELIRGATEAEILGNSTPIPEEVVELDFDPDLFPSEAMELDQEHTVSENLAGEVVTLDDETLIDEMQWDEPPDSTTEEMTASPESEFDSDFFGEEPLDLEVEDIELGAILAEVMASDQTALSEETRHDLSDTTQDPTLPPEALDDDFDEFSEAALDLDQQEVVSIVIPSGLMTPDEESLSQEVEDDLSDNTQDTALFSEALEDDSDKSPIMPDQEALNDDQPDAPDVATAPPLDSLSQDLPQPETLNREQADNPEKHQRNSDSEANR